MAKSPQQKNGPFDTQGMPFPMPPMPGQGQPPFQPPFIPAFPFPLPQPQNAQPPIPPMPFGQPQGQAAFPFAPPSPAPSDSDEKPVFGPSSFQLPFSTIPQPHEVFESSLKGTIWFLKLILAASEAARNTTVPKPPAANDESEESNPEDAPVGPGASSDFIDGLVRSIFDASNTDYFYED